MTHESQSRKVALITGSGRRRVGSVVARVLAESDFDVALHYHRSLDSAKEVADELRDMGVRCENFQADVTAEHEVDRLIDNVLTRFGRLDALVTTASIWESQALPDVTGVGLLICAPAPHVLLLSPNHIDSAIPWCGLEPQSFRRLPQGV